jgi:hypothetical protein
MADTAQELECCRKNNVYYSDDQDHPRDCSAYDMSRRYSQTGFMIFNDSRWYPARATVLRRGAATCRDGDTGQDLQIRWAR